MSNLGKPYQSISGVKMDLSTFRDFLEWLQEDHLTVEQVEERRWHAKWGGCEGCWIVALPVKNELRIDFYFLEWDEPEHPSVYEDGNGGLRIESKPNVWPRLVFDTVRSRLIELGVLHNVGTGAEHRDKSEVSAGAVSTLLLEISIPDFMSNVAFWNKKDRLGLIPQGSESRGAVWSVDNCLITARVVTPMTTRVELEPFRWRQNAENYAWPRLTPDAQAKTTWHKLCELIAENCIQVLPQSRSSRVLEEFHSNLPPFYGQEEEINAWKAEHERKYKHQTAKQAARGWLTLLQGTELTSIEASTDGLSQPITTVLLTTPKAFYAWLEDYVEATPASFWKTHVALSPRLEPTEVEEQLITLPRGVPGETTEAGRMRLAIEAHAYRKKPPSPHPLAPREVVVDLEKPIESRRVIVLTVLPLDDKIKVAVRCLEPKLEDYSHKLLETAEQEFGVVSQTLAGSSRGRKRKPNIDTPIKVAKARLIMELRSVNQTVACGRVQVSPHTFRKHHNHPDVLAEMERLRQDKDFLEEV